MNEKLEAGTIRIFANILLITISSIGGRRRKSLKIKDLRDTVAVVYNFRGDSLNHFSTKIYNEKTPINNVTR
jgi:hypothetical protein